MAGAPKPEINKEWYQIIKDSAAESSKQEPFLTLIALLSTVIIIVVVPSWLRQHYRYITLREQQRSQFDAIREGKGHND